MSNDPIRAGKTGAILSRRRFLAATGAALLALAGGAALVVRGPRGLIAAIWDRAFGPFAMDGNERERLIGDTLAFLHEAGASAASERLLGAGYSLLSLPGARGFVPEGMRFKIEQYERQTVTYFLLNTDYLAKGGMPRSRVSYAGPKLACQSPWAEFG